MFHFLKKLKLITLLWNKQRQIEELLLMTEKWKLAVLTFGIAGKLMGTNKLFIKTTKNSNIYKLLILCKSLKSPKKLKSGSF